MINTKKHLPRNFYEKNCELISCVTNFNLFNFLLFFPILIIIGFIVYRFTIHEEMRSSGVYSSLSIKKAGRTDSAVYTCVATNTFGSADTNTNLIVQGKYIIIIFFI